MTESRRKRRRKNKSRRGRGEDSGSSEDEEIQRSTKVVDTRKWCVYCTKIVVRGGVGKGRGGPVRSTKTQRFPPIKARKTSTMCFSCRVPLCAGKWNCFSMWHDKHADLPIDDEQCGNGEGQVDDVANNNEEITEQDNDNKVENQDEKTGNRHSKDHGGEDEDGGDDDSDYGEVEAV